MLPKVSESAVSSKVLLRFVAISILILIALRLLGRLMATLFGPAANRTAARPTNSPQDGSTGGRSLPRQLEACPHCGTYFDPQRTADAARSAEQRFCSAGCFDAHALQSAEGPPSGAPPADGSAS